MKILVNIIFVSAFCFLETLGCQNAANICPNPAITYWLYTRNNPPYQLNVHDPSNIANAPFVNNKAIFVLFNGYDGNRNNQLNGALRTQLLAQDNCNVISPDYAALVAPPCYSTAVANLPVIGRCSAQMIETLVSHINVSLGKFHLIGFSLGAHATGQVAAYVHSGRVGRITGLDPTQPMFEFNANRNLNPNDASFVDVLYTNAGSYGSSGTLGHANFYANGGFNQPGCFSFNIEDMNRCSHFRAVDYYTESISNPVGFRGVKCLLWSLLCLSTNYQYLGLRTSTSASGSYYFSTASHSPFALG